jgi:hypothetical protein
VSELLRVKTTLLLLIAILVMNGGCQTRPSFDEASLELSRLLDSAIQTGFAGSTEPPEREEGRDACGDPLLGPSDGLQPTLSYRLPISSLTDGPEAFITSVANLWKGQGLAVESQRTENELAVFASKENYDLQAFVGLANETAILSGTGPCVDKPNPA